MKPLRRGWQRLWGAFFGGPRESDLDAELKAHLEMEVEDNLRQGMSPEDARRSALLKFGGVENVKESIRDQRGLPWLEGVVADLRFSMRTLRKSPSFTLVAALTLGLGIGANTAVFSLVNELLIHPTGISKPERTVAVLTRYDKLNINSTVSATTFADLRGIAEVFEKTALMSRGAVSYADGPAPERLQTGSVTAEWFEVLGVQPMLGRVFSADDDQPGRDRMAVLSHAAWIRLFGGDPSVIGRTIELDRTPVQVVGVMKPDHVWPRSVDVWTPMGLPPSAFESRRRYNDLYFAAARLRPGVSFEQANTSLRLLSNRVASATDSNGVYAKNSGWRAYAVPITDIIAGSAKRPLVLLLTAVGFVLLIACSNIAGLMLARTSVRARELAVRAALGASRGRLLRQAISESLLLANLGGIVGLMIAVVTVHWVPLLAPELGIAETDGLLNIYVLLFCAGTTTLSGILFGIVPAWPMLRRDVHQSLQIVGRSATVGTGKQRLRSLLVVGETAVALVLLVAAGLSLRGLIQLQESNPGFNPNGIMTAMFALPQDRYPGGREQAGFYREILERLRANKAVTGAALAYPLPFSGYQEGGAFEIEGHLAGQEDPRPYGDRRFVTAGYFETLSVPLKKGRAFTSEDRVTSEPVVVIDETLARRYWQNEDPVGKRIRSLGNQWHTIVGVVGSIKHSDLASDTGPGVYYFTLAQRARSLASIVVKTSGEPTGMADTIREAVRAADSGQAVYGLRSMADLLAGSLGPRRFTMQLLEAFALMALLLAALGIYGVISYAVTQRTREIGIRLALGATRNSIRRLVMVQGLSLVGIGTVIGTGGALLAGPLLQSEFSAITPSDPWVLSVSAATLLAAALLATYLPARRAIRVDPAMTLREE